MADSVSSVNTNNSLYNNGVQRKANGQLDKNAFLYILTTELSNQDPMNTKDNTEYIAQLAQFSSLEQMQNLNTSISQMLANDKFIGGASLIGQNVRFKVGDDLVLDKVKSVSALNGDVVIVGDSGNIYAFDEIFQINAGDNDKESQDDNVDAGGVQNDNQSSE